MDPMCRVVCCARRISLTSEKRCVLRFRPDRSGLSGSGSPLSSRGTSSRWRLWMLLIALGFVVATMRQLNQPSTAQRLGRLFGSPEITQRPSLLSEDDSLRAEFSAAISKETKAESVAAAQAAAAQTTGERTDFEASAGLLASIQDNTYFRPAESEAWFGLLGRLSHMDRQQLRAASLGELGYAQLLKQPQTYRGEVVTIRGTLRREERVAAAQNAVGLESYHRLVIQPQGGGHWPLIVYCLEWPGDFPRGDALQAPVTATGFFFKNWSYAWQDGLGVAPVILARAVDLQQAPRATTGQPVTQPVTKSGWAEAMLMAGVFALLVVGWVLRNTRQPVRTVQPAQAITLPNAETTTTSVQERLQSLAEVELRE